MIWYVAFAQDDEVDHSGGKYFRDQVLFQELSGQPCLVVRYKDTTLELAERLQPRAIVMGGFGRSFETFGKEALLRIEALVKATAVPILGICGSHQLNAMFYNYDLRRMRRFKDEPMGKLRPGEPELQAAYHPGYRKEAGFYEVRIVKPDPLFAGFKSSGTFCESHYCEVKKLPRGFGLLASTEACRIQADRHPTKPLYGVQFHPEAYVGAYPDGRKLLANFFRKIARTHR